MVIHLFLFSVSSWFCLGRMYISKNLSPFVLCWHIIFCSNLLWSFVFLQCLFKYLLWFYLFGLCLLWVWLKVYQFWLSFQRTSSRTNLIDLFYCLFLVSISFICRRRQWHPTPVLLPGKFHGWRSLVDYSPWGRKESDTTDWLHYYYY